MLDLVSATNPFWECNISSWNYDMISGEISLTIGEDKNTREMKFQGVSSVHYISNYDNKYDKEETYFEVSCLVFKKSTMLQAIDETIKPYSLDSNVIIESVNRICAIKAQQLIVDGIEYKL